MRSIFWKIREWWAKKNHVSPYSGTAPDAAAFEQSLRIRQLQAEERRLTTQLKIQDMEANIQEMRDVVSQGSSNEPDFEQQFLKQVMDAVAQKQGGGVPSSWDTPNPNFSQVTSSTSPDLKQYEATFIEWAKENGIPQTSLLDLKSRLERKV